MKKGKVKNKKKYIIFAIVLLVIVAGFFIFGKGGKNKSVTATVQKGEIKEELVLSGSIKADKHVVLYFPTGGKIAGVYVKEGQWAKRGQALTSLDKTVLNSTYQQSLNTYRSYQAAAENAVDSVKGHSADESFAQKSTRTTAEAARDSAYDAVKAAGYNLANATIYAPFEGVVASLPFPSPGVNVNITDAQVELLDPSSIYFDVGADQSEVINIKDKQNVEIVLDSYRGTTLSGTVSFIGYTPKANESGTVYKVKVVFGQNEFKDNLPRIGMSGDAKFILSQKEDVLLVPARFINTDKDGKFVNLGKMGNKVRVTIGIEGEENTEILSGVKEGDILFD